MVFDNRVLRRIFGPKRDEVMGEWRKLHSEELRDLYSSPSIIRMMKSRRIRWAGHVAQIGRKEICIGYWWGSHIVGYYIEINDNFSHLPQTISSYHIQNHLWF
jgi:hypothetical protein